MKRFILKIGSTKTIFLITLFSIFASYLISLLVGLFTSIKPSNVMTFIAPLTIAPLVSAPMVKLLFQINALEAKMRDLATYDSLTKVLNRRAFLERAEYAYQLAKREQQQFAILLVDLDFFKSINDEYGHATGDQVLALFGQVTEQISRASDVVGRIGGEEFAFFLSNTNLAQAEVFSARLHEAISQVSVEYQGLLIRFSVSIGVATFSGKNMSNLDALIQFADEAMYRAKKQGRNQTVKVEGL